MEKKANDTFAFDLENRLDDFFSDSLPSQEEAPEDDSPAVPADLPLKELKSTILAIDWEITDAALDDFIYQVDELTEQFADDKRIHTLLRLLKSLGKYMRAQKSKAHPDTIKRIMAVYSALEDFVTKDEIDQDEKEKMLLEEIKQFKRLKSKIVAARSPHLASGSQKPIKSDETSGLGTVIKAINELKSLMATELGVIRKELGQLRKK